MTPPGQQTQRKQIVRTLPICHRIAAGLFLVSLLLWLVDPGPAMYLLASALLGVLWFGAVVWMWRMWCFVANLAAMFAFALYLVPERLFHPLSQVQEVQGGLLAFSIVSILLYVFRDAVVRYGRLHSDTEPGAAPNGGPATASGNSGAMGGPPSVS
jgi:hypothetical protein